MAQIEPMDIESDLEDKENSIQHSNVLPRTPCTEKGYEELDVSEMSMKLRYSITPASSPMSKSFTTTCRDNITIDNGKNDYILSSNNLTNSLNSTLTNYDSKLSKVNPLQPLSTDTLVDLNGNPIVRRSLDISTIDNNVPIVVHENHADEHFSLPSTSSSATHTPEATTPTKEITKDGGSPIMRGLKSVFSMFRSSQSPIPPSEATPTQLNLSPIYDCSSEVCESKHLVSTPIVKNKEALSKRNSPLKDSVVFKDDLEKELQWKEETVLFKDEKIPIHKLFSQQPHINYSDKSQNTVQNENYNVTVEYIDISQNASVICNNTMADDGVEYPTDIIQNRYTGESDGEFVDCETTITKIEMDISEVNIKDINGVSNTEPLNISDKITESSNVLEVQQLACNNLLDDTSILNVVGEQKEVKVIDIASEFIAIPPSNQSEENKYQIEKVLIESNIEASALSTEQHHLIETHNNDNMTEPLGLLDDVSVPIHVNTSASNINKKENVFEEYRTENSTNISDLQNTLVVITQHENSDDINLKSKEKNICIGENDNVIDNESVYIKSTENDTVGISTTLRSQMAQEIVAHSANIANMNAEECNSNIFTCKEIVAIDNVLSNLECDKLPDSLPEQMLFERSDVQLTILQHGILPSVERSKVLESLKLNDITSSDLVKQNMDVIGCDRPMELVETKLMPIKTEYCMNKKEEVANITKILEDPKITVTSNIASQVSDLNTLKTIKLNDNLPANVPLPSDSELEEESKKEKQIISEIATNASIVIHNVTESAYTDKREEYVEHDKMIVKTINESFDKETVAIQNNISMPTNPECLYTTLDIDNQGPDHHKTDAVLDGINIVDLIVPNTNVSGDISKDCEKIEADTCVMSSNVNDNNAPILKYDTININKELNNSINSINFPDLPVNPLTSSNVIDDHPKIDYDEEIITSASSSPYVSVTDMAIGSINQDNMKDILEDIENPFMTKAKISESPPISPKLITKSYDFSFDDIVDPFATKTKIRVSPTPESPKQQTILTTPQDNKSKKKNIIQKRESHKNRRKSQLERKSLSTSKSLNRTFDAISNDNEFEQHLDNNNHADEAGMNEDNHLKKEEIKDFCKISNTTQILDHSKQVLENLIAVKNCYDAVEELDKIETNDNNTFSTEFITSQPQIISENVLFPSDTFEASCDQLITKSAIIISPPSIPEICSSSDTNKPVVKSFIVSEQSKQSDGNNCKTVDGCSSNISVATFSSNNSIDIHDDISEFQEVEKECSANVSIATCSSKNTDENHTVREIHTEDEDTIEGPFLEIGEDFNHINVIRDFVSDKNMMHFDIPSSQKKNEHVDDGELFIDAETFEFLLNQNKSTVIADSGKESLFLKFDPLYAKRVSSDGVLAALSKIKKMQSTPKKVSKQTNEVVDTELPSSSKSDVNSEEVRDDPEVLSTPKPMMVVNPAVNQIVVPRKISTPKLNRHSLSFTSPAIAVIDRLLSLSGNNSLIDQNTSLPQSTREQNETDIAITQLREMLAEKEIHVHNLRSESKDLKDRLSSLESQMKCLETESEQRLKKVTELNERLAEKTKINRGMAAVVEEYERTIASLITDMEQEKKHNSEEKMKLVKERDEQTAHLASMEVSFNDLHSKYEKSKQIILSMKANEDTYKKSIQDFEDNLLKMQNNYELLKQHATSKLNHANQELEKFNKAHESEVLKLNALIKRKEMHITSLEETLAQKTKANEELTAICDELINKVG